MNLQSGQLYFSHKPSKHTRKLLDLLKNKSNLSKINKSLKFEFIVAYPEDSQYYKGEGIVGFPALVIKDEITIGTPAIIKFLSTLIKNGPKNHNEIEALDNYMLSSAYSGVGKGNDGKLNPVDDDDDEKDELQKQLAQAIQDRKKRVPNFGEGMTTFAGARQVQENAPEPENNNIYQEPITQQQPRTARARVPRTNNVAPPRQAPSRQPRRNVIAPKQSKIPIGDRMKAGLGAATDDDLLNNFLENQTTTDL